MSVIATAQYRLLRIQEQVNPELGIIKTALNRIHGIVRHILASAEETQVAKPQSVYKEKFRNIVKKVLGLFSRDKMGKIVKNSTVLVSAYWVEFLDPRHRRPYGSMKDPFKKWSEDPTLHTQMSYMEYLKSIETLNPQDPSATYPSVDYFSEKERAQYAVAVEAQPNGEGIITSQGKPLEKGTYAIVLGPDSQLYAGKKIRDKLHHSSFFGGKSVLGAGQILIENGVLKEFNGLSGHYRPTPKSDKNVLTYLKDHGVDAATFKFTPYLEAKTEKSQARKLAKSPVISS